MTSDFLFDRRQGLLDVANGAHRLDLVVVAHHARRVSHNLQGLLRLLEILLHATQLLLHLAQVVVLLNRRQDTVDVLDYVACRFVIRLKGVRHRRSDEHSDNRAHGLQP